MFWDYSATKMDLNRRVCVPFALVWGPLTALTVRYVHPWVSALARSMPPAVTCAALLVLVADCFCPPVCCAAAGISTSCPCPALPPRCGLRAWR